jgi:hypothetical protein
VVGNHFISIAASGAHDYHHLPFIPPHLRNHMSVRLFPFAVAALAASLTGCLTQEQTYHLNSDGSGKLVLAMTVDTSMMGALGGGGGAGQDMGKEVALQLLRGTQGIDTWADLTHETAADGKTQVNGTAFFKDINKLQMSAGEQAGGASAGALTSTRSGDSWTVSVGLVGGDSAPSAASEGAKLSAEQVKTAMQQAQAQWEASKSLVAPMVEGAKITTTVKAGGTVKETVGFAKVDDQTASMSFGGAKVISAIDAMMNDPKIMEEALAGGDAMGVLRDQKRMQKTIMESLTEGKGMPKVELTPGAPAFDYAAEVAKAKAGQSDAFKALLAEASAPKGGPVVRPPGAAPKKINPPAKGQ